MSVSPLHIFSQSQGFRALGETAVRGVLSRVRTPKRPQLPGPEMSVTLPPRSRALVEAYVRHAGGDPQAYGDTLPAHFFPQWSFLLMSRCLRSIPYPVLKVVNAGCRMEMRRPIPMGEPLVVRARLEGIDADERRAVMTQRVVTGTASEPEALVAYVDAFVSLGEQRSSREEVRALVVPGDAAELETLALSANAGLEYALLAGDFNPIHWLPPYARAMGFPRPILHGFATLARTVEALNLRAFGGDVDALESIEVRFRRPLVLPATVKIYSKENSVYAGSAPGKVPFLEGTFATRAPRA